MLKSTRNCSWFFSLSQLYNNPVQWKSLSLIFKKSKVRLRKFSQYSSFRSNKASIWIQGSGCQCETKWTWSNPIPKWKAGETKDSKFTRKTCSEIFVQQLKCLFPASAKSHIFSLQKLPMNPFSSSTSQSPSNKAIRSPWTTETGITDQNVLGKFIGRRGE